MSRSHLVITLDPGGRPGRLSNSVVNRSSESGRIRMDSETSPPGSAKRYLAMEKRSVMRSFQFVKSDSCDNPVLRWVLMALSCLLFTLAIDQFWMAAFLVNRDYIELFDTNRTIEFVDGNDRAIIVCLAVALVVTLVSVGMFMVGLRHGRRSTPAPEPIDVPQSSSDDGNPYRSPGS